MGGIVARLVAEDADKIITLSTPHTIPPTSLDSRMVNIYRKLSTPRAPVISICGGIADSQIASDACVLPPGSNGLTVFTTGMVGAWTGCDHQAIVWCHQIRWRIARVLLETTRSVDPIEEARRWLLPDVQVEGVSDSRQVFDIHGLTSITVSERPTAVELCDSACHPVVADIQVMPRIRSPFPSPGEGVAADDVDYTVVVNATGRLALGVSPNARVIAGRVTSRWSPTAARVTLDLPNGNSLLVYRLDVKIGECAGPKPVVKQINTAEKDVHEERFWPTDQPVLLHSHVGSAPYVKRPSKGFELQIMQSLACPVVDARVRLDYWRTAAKAFSRYRMAALAWTLGWSGILSVLHVQEIWMPVGMILFAAAAQCAVGNERWLLGVTEWRILPVHLGLALWTLSLVASVRIGLGWLRDATKRYRSPGASTRKGLLVMCLAWVAVGTVVPRDLLGVMILAWQMVRLCTLVSADASLAKGRRTVVRWSV